MNAILQKILITMIGIIVDLIDDYGKDAIDAALDQIEKRYYDDDSGKGKLIMKVCGSIRTICSVDDDDEDQASPK